MSEWNEIKLGKIADLTNGFAFKSKDFTETGVPVIKIKNVKPQLIKLDELSYVNDSTVKGKEKWKLKMGDILITMSGNRADGSPDSWVGKVAQFKREGTYYLNQRVSIIKPIVDYVDSTFLAYQLSSWDYQLELINLANSSGGQANISPDIVKGLNILLPPLPEQERIAEVLGSLDNKIDLLHRQNKTLEEMAETLFRQWFVEEADDSWEEVTIGSLCNKVTKGTTPTTMGKPFVEKGINFIKAESLNEFGGFINNKFSFIDESTHNLLQRSQIEKGDILFTIAGTIGRTAIVTSSILPANTNQAVAIIRVDKEKINQIFMKYVMKSDYIQEIMESKIVHAVQPNLSLGEISDTKIKLPPKEKLDKFELVGQSIQNKINLNNNLIQQLETLRDTLLPKLMSGEVRVQNLNDQNH